MIYLDNASTTKLHPKVLEAMMPYLTDEYGNAGAIYSFGVSARQAVERAREQVAALIGAEAPEQILFTSGGTESNSWVFFNTSIEAYNSSRNTVVVSSVEHDSVLKAAKRLEEHYGFNGIRLGVTETGVVSRREVERGITTSTALCSVMLVNNEVGSINDAELIGEICKDKGATFHCDAVQAPGCVNIDVEKIKCDFLSLSSHKLHGPKGVGALYVRDTRLLNSMVLGGVNQEFGFRGGTENVPGIVGFGKACELVPGNMAKAVDHVSYKEVKKAFHSRLIASLMGSAGGKRIKMHINAGSLASDGKVLNIRFDGVDAETLVLIAGTKGLCISAGSACHSRNQEPSHVLKAIGLKDDEARESVRISFSDFNTLKEVRDGAQILAKSLLVYSQI